MPKIWEESSLNLPGTHYLSVLSYSITATYLEYPEVQDVQRYDQGKEGWNPTTTEQDT